MILIKNILLAIIGLTSGGFVAAGVFAFITMIGVLPRLAGRTATAKYILYYEDMVILGGTLGNLLVIFQYQIPIGIVGLILFGFFSGIFVGCIAIALAEVLKTIPVFARRIRLVQGMPFIVISLALGKCFGTLYQMVFSSMK